MEKVKKLTDKDLKIMNLVCKRDDLDNVLKDLIFSEKCQFINSYTEIDNKDFAIEITEENADEILNMVDVEPIKQNKKISEYLEEIKKLSKKLNYSPQESKSYLKGDIRFDSIKESVEEVIEKLQQYNDEIEILEKKLKQLKSLRFMKTLKGYNINLMKVMDMNHFSTKIGYLTKEKREQISRNYKNISAIVFHVGGQEEKEYYLIISAKSRDVEMSRILKSTNFKEIIIPQRYLGIPEEAEKLIKQDIENYKSMMNDMKDTVDEFIKRNRELIDEKYSILIMSKKIDEIKENIGASETYAYISAFVSNNKNENFDYLNEKYDNVLIKYKINEKNSFLQRTNQYLHDKWSSFFS